MNELATIDNKYHIVKRLGSGGFSDVYLAQGPEGPCAIKLLKTEILSSKEDALDKFKHEFELLKDMCHPNIAGILDFGFDSEQGHYYFTSEFIDGPDIFSATVEMKPEDGVDLIVQALRALEYLHSYKVHHFDIKAANVLIASQKREEASDERPATSYAVKIIDFGLADIDPRGKLIGTPSYMPPEIVERGPTDGRADLYSLGVLWYSILTRSNPFRGATTDETLSRQLHFMPPPPSSKEPKVPGWMDGVIMRLIEKNPSNRFQTADSVIREINRKGGKHYPLETSETLLSYLPDEGRFIGREEEIKKVEDIILKIAPLGGMSQSLVVSGERGAGKSRFLSELKYRLQLKELRVRYASGCNEVAFNEWCNRLQTHVTEGNGMEVFFLDDVDSLSGNEPDSNRLLALIARAKRPAVKASLFVAMALEEGGQFAASIESASQANIRLGPFSAEELKNYLTSLTGLENPPGSLSAGIFKRTEGNPLFVTEVIRSLIARGGLFDEHGRWKEGLFEDMGVDFSKVIVPTTIGDLLMERVQELSEPGKKLIEYLSVYGAPTSTMKLGELPGLNSPHTIVFELIRKDILERVDALNIGFHNTLMAEVISRRIPTQRRRRMHEEIARVLQKGGASPEEIQEHKSQGEDSHAAIHASIDLGEKLLTAGRGRAAAVYFDRAIERIGPNDSEHLIQILVKQGEAYLIGHDYGAAKDKLQAAQELLSKDTKTPEFEKWRVETLMRLGGTFIKLSEFERAREVFEKALDAIRTVGGDKRRELTIANLLASILMQEGRLNEAREIFGGTRGQAKDLPQEERIKLTNNDLGVVLLALKDLATATAILEDDLKTAETLGDDMLIARANYNLAQLALSQKDRPKAIEYYRISAEVCRRSNNTELLLCVYNGMGNTYHLMEDADESIKSYERGLELHERIFDLRGGAAISVNMGIVEASRGNLDVALDRLIPAVSYLKGLLQKTAANWMVIARGLLEIGDIWRRKGKTTDAKANLNEALEITDRVLQAKSMRFWVLATMAEVASATGEYAELSRLVDLLKPMASDPSEETKAAEIEEKLKETSMKDAAAQNAAFSKILEINKLIAGKTDLDFVLKTVLHYALDLSGAEAGAILLINDAGELLVAADMNMQDKEDEVHFSKTFAMRAIESGSHIRTDNASTDERFSAEASVSIHKLRSILCLPIKARGRAIGALYLDHRFQSAAFANADMEFLNAFADQAGIAIDISKFLSEHVKKEENLKNELSEASMRIERYKTMVEEESLDYGHGALSTKSPAMKNVLKVLGKVADTDLTVFIYGETGTGKELVARALHANNSKRKDRKFVAINCGAIPPTLIESELFGYKAGAFTGATKDKRGLIEEANGGTLFLDEIAELTPTMQVKLLRVLQERECMRVGATTTYPVDIRLIAAANQDVSEMIKDGKFREDFYYRICQIKLNLPPLKERTEDIFLLIDKFIVEASPKKKLRIHPSLMKRMLCYNWPGNIRELQNFIQVACALAEGDVIDERAIPTGHPLSVALFPPPSIGGERGKGEDRRHSPLTPALSHKGRGGGEIKIDDKNEYDSKKSWKDYERAIVAKCYEANSRNVKASAEELGVSLSTMYKRVAEWNLDNQSESDFTYTRGKKLDDYLLPVFTAALAASGNKPSLAIANLRISQGYFYKVMRRR